MLVLLVGLRFCVASTQQALSKWAWIGLGAVCCSANALPY